MDARTVEPTGESLEIGTLAPAGYHVAVRIKFAYPVKEHINLPEDWIARFTSGGYILHDPVTRWLYDNTGWARWSALGIEDPQGILSEAAEYGLRYGVAISLIDEERNERTFGRFCRSDRELTDDEIAEAMRLTRALHRSFLPPANLTGAEIEALRLSRKGMRVKQMAFELGISESAVKARLQNAKRKLHAKTSVQAAAIAESFNLI